MNNSFLAPEPWSQASGQAQLKEEVMVAHRASSQKGAAPLVVVLPWESLEDCLCHPPHPMLRPQVTHQDCRDCLQWTTMMSRAFPARAQRPYLFYAKAPGSDCKDYHVFGSVTFGPSTFRKALITIPRE
uniref:Uncharacterized protein n=1 Tax=Molossus molossus TaxID=27622 RepID=A0A7J8I9A9_MOLMO|nr:hypothetical protein HJG59_010648 [Molossus molossus]